LEVHIAWGNQDTPDQLRLQLTGPVSFDAGKQEQAISLLENNGGFTTAVQASMPVQAGAVFTLTAQTRLSAETRSGEIVRLVYLPLIRK
jgi:hypothetical protein